MRKMKGKLITIKPEEMRKEQNNNKRSLQIDKAKDPRLRPDAKTS